MASIELEAARRRLTLAQEEVQRAQASLVLHERHDFSETLTLVAGLVSQAQQTTATTASDRASVAEAALDNIRLALEHAGVTPEADVQGSPPPPSDG